jgi:hypothetical protein
VFWIHRQRFGSERHEIGRGSAGARARKGAALRDIKPIETVFNGHRFRSRLEARWAVFFHELLPSYEYEIEGFDLGKGLRYLPDFYLPTLDLYVEVKPTFEAITDQDMRKIALFGLSKVKNEKRLLVIVGTPGSHQMLLHTVCEEAWQCMSLEYQDNPETLHEVFFDCCSKVTFGGIPFMGGFQLIYSPADDYSECYVTLAFKAARQARFEHGRSGN